MPKNRNAAKSATSANEKPAFGRYLISGDDEFGISQFISCFENVEAIAIDDLNRISAPGLFGNVTAVVTLPKLTEADASKLSSAPIADGNNLIVITPLDKRTKAYKQAAKAFVVKEFVLPAPWRIRDIERQASESLESVGIRLRPTQISELVTALGTDYRAMVTLCESLEAAYDAPIESDAIRRALYADGLDYFTFSDALLLGDESATDTIDALIGRAAMEPAPKILGFLLSQCNRLIAAKFGYSGLSDHQRHVLASKVSNRLPAFLIDRHRLILNALCGIKKGVDLEFSLWCIYFGCDGKTSTFAPSSDDDY
ncbi:hypothetical protein [Roseofilum capinflatum]|uniref:DNA polymerase III subunit delta n=1 Tax=Roseofilum capinflatum BLCC-M114 TaxID=3022440 RepID=A0ABT7B6A0_9CYAN|nr:hypothetical protein [Roseofilum capinflatum]MDJ1174704.1 hypothetical protein [Roseofilum capinflatum BLCC-M114]